MLVTAPGNTDFAPRSSAEETARRREILETFRNSPVPPDQLLYSQLALYLPRQELSRTLAIAELYREHVVPANGVLTGTGAEDGSHPPAHDCAYSSGAGYERHVPIIKGDAAVTISEYLARHPETAVAMAYFDFDIYAPTKTCLEAIRPHLTRNSVLAFDELNCPEYPGESRALAEVAGLGRCRLMRSPLTPWLSYTMCREIAWP